MKPFFFVYKRILSILIVAVCFLLCGCEVSNDATIPIRIWGKWKVETMSYNKTYITEQYNSYIFEFKSSDSLLIQNTPEFAVYEETHYKDTNFIFIGGFQESKFAIFNKKWTILQRCNSIYELETKDTNNLFINMRIYKL